MSVFVVEVVARLDPVLAPRGFPHQADADELSPLDEPSESDDAVLFHCDGPDAVAEVIRRYPGWGPALRASYGPEPILCLDLWVGLHRERTPWWTFEVFTDDVARAAGEAAMHRLDATASTDPMAWIGHLADVLDAYFATLDRAEGLRG